MLFSAMETACAAKTSPTCMYYDGHAYIPRTLNRNVTQQEEACDRWSPNLHTAG